MANNVPGIVMLGCPPIAGLRFGEQFRERPETPPGEDQLTAIGETPLRLPHPPPGTRLKILFDELNGGGRVIRGHGFPLIAHRAVTPAYAGPPRRGFGASGTVPR